MARRFSFLKEGSPAVLPLFAARWGVSLTDDAALLLLQGSALRAGVLSFASPKESSQRKGDPRLRGRLRRLPCATRCWRGLRNSALRASDSPRPLSAISSVARRSTWGPGKASRNDGSAQEEKRKCLVFNGRPLKTAQNHSHRFGGDAFGVPLRGAEQRRLAGGFRLASVRAAGEFSKPPGQPSSARDRATPGADPGVAFSLATFFWRSKRKYARAASAEPNSQTKTTSSVAAKTSGEQPSNKHQKANPC